MSAGILDLTDPLTLKILRYLTLEELVPILQTQTQLRNMALDWSLWRPTLHKWCEKQNIETNLSEIRQFNRPDLVYRRLKKLFANKALKPNLNDLYITRIGTHTKYRSIITRHLTNSLDLDFVKLFLDDMDNTKLKSIFDNFSPAKLSEAMGTAICLHNFKLAEFIIKNYKAHMHHEQNNLLLAAQTGEKSFVALMLELQSASGDALYILNTKTAYEACCSGDVGLVKHLLNQTDENRNPIINPCQGFISAAAFSGRQALLEFLLKLRDEYNQPLQIHTSAIIAAASSGKLDLIIFLLSIKDKNGKSIPAIKYSGDDQILRAAAWSGSIALIDYLTETNGLNLKLQRGCIDAAVLSNNLAMVKKAGTLTNKQGAIYAPTLRTLAMAATSNNISIINYILSNVTIIETDPYYRGDTQDVLASFASSGSIALLNLLFEQKNELNQNINFRPWMLTGIAESGNAECYHYGLTLIPDDTDISPRLLGNLHSATRSGNQSLVKLILDSGTMPDLDVLTSAATSGDCDLFSFLMTKTDENGKQLLPNTETLRMASMSGKLAIVKLILKTAKQYKIALEINYHVLSAANYSQNNELYKYLLEKIGKANNIFTRQDKGSGVLTYRCPTHINGKIGYPSLLTQFGCKQKNLTPNKLVNTLWLIKGSQKYGVKVAAKVVDHLAIWAKQQPSKTKIDLKTVHDQFNKTYLSSK